MFSTFSKQASSVAVAAIMLLILFATGCAGSGTGFGGGGGGGNSPSDGFYKGSISSAKRRVASKVGDAVSFQFKGSTGNALFTRSNPDLFSYTADITNINFDSSKKTLKFSLVNFSGEYKSGTFSGSCTLDSSGHIASTTGNLDFILPDGSAEHDTIVITFQQGVPAADFTGHWSGTLTASVLGGQSSNFNFVGDYNQDASGNLTANITYTDPSTNTPYSGQLTGLAAGNTYAGSETQTVPPYGTATGSFIGTLNSDGSMDGQINVKKDVLGATITIVTGTFHATRSQSTTGGGTGGGGNKEAVQFANATQNSSNATLRAFAGTTAISTGTTQGSISSVAQVPAGTAALTVQQSSGTSVFNAQTVFTNTRRAVIVALDDTSASQVDLGAVIYTLPATLPSGHGSIGVVEGINTDANHLGTNVDIYITLNGTQMSTTPDGPNMAYTTSFSEADVAGNYTVTATTHGVPTDVLATGTVAVNAGQRIVMALVSPPGLQAKFVSFTAASF